MKNPIRSACGLLSLSVMYACQESPPDMDTMNETVLQAPVAEKKDCVLTVHGHERIDPYFWMRLSDEQKNAAVPDEHTQKVIHYLNAENAYARAQLQHTEALQDTLFREMTNRIKKEDETVPALHNGYYYYTRYEEGSEYPIHCRRKGKPDAPEEVILNVNLLAEGQAYYAATGLRVSPDNRILAFGEDTLSRRVYTLRFRNLESGEFLPDRIENTTGSGAWANDNQTYFYTSKNNISLLSEKIWSHRLGSDAGNDILKYHQQDPSYYIGVERSKSGKYVFIEAASTMTDQCFFLDADQPSSAFQAFTPLQKNMKYHVEHAGDRFLILTNLDAVNFRLMECPEDRTHAGQWKEIWPHKKDVLLAGLEVFERFYVLTERSNALTHLRVVDRKTGENHSIGFEEPAYVVYSTGNAEYHTNLLRFAYSSLTTPTSVYDYDMASRQRTLKKTEEVVGGHDPLQYQTERLFVKAGDGARIPVSLVYRKGLKRDGSAPLLLYGYGSYGASVDPAFLSDRLSLLDRGFVFAIAHIRGGQELGRAWYENGKMFHKKNTFTDFIDCARYLVSEKYSSPPHLYATGGSAGGLLMGAVINMAPELFHGVVARVPFVDVVSTMLDESIPLTTNEFDEWGNPKNKDSYEYMLSYSPYDNIKPLNYPHMLVTTGLFDSQVQYWEPAKWVARLRDMKTGDNKLLLDVNMEAGHGGASGRFKRYHETAKIYAFLLDLEGARKQGE